MVPNRRCAARHETVIEKEINSSPISWYPVLPLDRGKIADQLVKPFCELNYRRMPHIFFRLSSKQAYVLFFFECIIISSVSNFFTFFFRLSSSI